MKGSILLIEDDASLLQYLEMHLTSNGFTVHAYNSPVSALESLAKSSVDLVLTDVKMPEMTGDEVLSHLKTHHPEIGLIMMTGFGSIEHGVNAIQKGAFDYITKPFQGPEILARINRFFKLKTQGTIAFTTNHGFEAPKRVESSTKETKSDSPSDVVTETIDFKLIGSHPRIKALIDALPQIAQNNAPVLIQGESGVGKEVFAGLIHYNSDRVGKPYVKINCANLPTELVESTLFGHIKGSFTGALADAKGAFDEADGGTLLLDEITEIQLNVQAKLLRVLQEKEFRPVGSQHAKKVDVRIIATSNRNISKTIQEGQFREDLFYRLNVFPIVIPSLRERKDDIPDLVNYFISKYASEYGMAEKSAAPELLSYLVQQSWKGNVRELNNLIQRGVLMSGSSKNITLAHIQNSLFSTLESSAENKESQELPLIPIEEMELQLIKKALERTGGNQKEAAELLGISDRTIRNKLKKLRLDDQED
ncbi:sigma-54-dependent Fis family transcriptional regulator [bacterium]|nr:MAG: sigma-54-dependent Fis family transcriptional regulator [bacterium]